ncbi:putative HVA22-like protein g [Diospyros lotus]|uniref:putative HVA22-like protein g n=1 Tax=Diospyros lotus TaxID=55363 RepID=UPI0022582C8A|nr:putative HVA22-like protein g [Diospyros lotus]
MLGDFITRGLILVLGYAYPAFECFKTVEKNKVEITELRFWCQYWIIASLLSVFERILDIFISWLPMYGEAKLALFIYLWYPKTKGSGYVYETFLRPYLAKHEPDIDRKLQELRARAWDLFIYHWQNCAKMGQTTFFQMVQYLVAQSGKLAMAKPSNNNNSNNSNNNEEPDQQIPHKEENQQQQFADVAAPPPTPTGSPSFHRTAKHKQQSMERRRPPLPPNGMASRSASEPPKPDAVQVHLHGHAEFIHDQDREDPEPESGSTDESESGVSDRLQAARLRLRRSKGFH